MALRCFRRHGQKTEKDNVNVSMPDGTTMQVSRNIVGLGKMLADRLNQEESLSITNRRYAIKS